MRQHVEAREALQKGALAQVWRGRPCRSKDRRGPRLCRGSRPCRQRPRHSRAPRFAAFNARDRRSGSLSPLGKEYAAHQTVLHAGREYVNKAGFTTNNIENFFGQLKRGLRGTFIHVGEQHLQRYLNEFSFRYSNRAGLGVGNQERAAMALNGPQWPSMALNGPQWHRGQAPHVPQSSSRSGRSANSVLGFWLGGNAALRGTLSPTRLTLPKLHVRMGLGRRLQ